MKENCVLSLRTPIGLIKVVHTAVGVKEISLDGEYNENTSMTNLCYKDRAVDVVTHDGEWHETVDITVDWLKAYFTNTKKQKSVINSLPPIDNEIFTRDNFTGKVLRTLANDVGYGKTVSYAELAKLCESPKACRAVGQAMRANPVPLIVPCHRVIASDGTAGNYMRGKGNNIKKWLIGFEQNC